MSTSEAFMFLQSLRPGGPWVLTAITPDGTTETITAHDAARVDAFVNANIGRRNIYYSLNPTRTPMSSKATKKDIAAVEYLHADLDPNDGESTNAAKAKYLERIAACERHATALVDSGNGIQALWKLETQVVLDSPERIADVEARTKALTLRLGGKAGTQNVDRILRLPGTVNLPNATKRKAGRVECPARLIEFNGASHPLDTFPREPEGAKAKAEGKRTGDGERRLPRDLVNMLHLSGDNPAGYQSRSELFYAFLCEALRRGVDENDIITACIDPALASHSIHDHVEENGGRDYLKRQIERAVNEVATTSDGKQIVHLRPGARYEAWRQTQWAVLQNPKCQVFHRAGCLVEPLWRWEKTADGRDVLVMEFVPYNVLRLSDVVARHAVAFQKYDGRGRRWVPVDPPGDVIATLLTRGDWEFPTVTGIINTPTMRPDGSLLTRPGYDPATKLWYKPAADAELPPIREQPTMEDALAALELLEGLLAEFPFVDEVSRSVALAAMMTPVLRGAFEHAPLFFFVAPESGTGKTYLVTLTSVIATGRPAPAVVGSEDKEEMEKRLSAIALEGLPIVSLNNLSFDLESGMLCQMITDDVVKIRILGKTEAPMCDCRGMTFFANGNNIRLVGDLVRRTVTATMNARIERPETRTFKYDPIVLVRENRGKYLAAIFTIARAFAAAGRPRPAEAKAGQLAGFEEWSSWIRHPLVWLGLKDPAESIEGARALDPQRAALRELIAALAKHMGIGGEFTAAQVYERAKVVDGRGLYPNQDLFDAFSRDDRRVSPKSIGHVLMSARDRVSGDLRIELASASSKTANTYRIVRVTQDEGAVAPETPDPDAM
jgi:putative DNA primase/helicase